MRFRFHLGVNLSHYVKAMKGFQSFFKIKEIYSKILKTRSYFL